MRKNIKYYLLAMPLLVTFLVLQAEASEVFNATGPIFSEPVRAKLRSKKETVLSSGIGAKNRQVDLSRRGQLQVRSSFSEI